jgi:hypothetical protein
MIKSDADLAKLTARQREVLVALARQLSKDRVAQFLHIAEATTNIDAEALLQAYATVQEVLSNPESSTAPSISSDASLAREWQKPTTQEPGGPATTRMWKR